jgi:hypothetical protein
VTVSDVMRVARRMLRSKPTLVVYTPEQYTKLIPTHEQVCAWFDAIGRKVGEKELSETTN